MLMMTSVRPALRPPGSRSRAAALAVVVAAAIVLATAAAAEERVLTLDPEASSVTFTLSAIMHKVEGRFRIVSGEIRFDPATGAAAGEVVIDAASGDTGNGRRDRRMHRETLDSEKWSRIVLRPTAFSGDLGTNGGGVMLSGELEAHGHRRSVDIPTWVDGIEDGRLRASGGFTMPYTAWGIPDPSGFFLRVSDSVEIHLEIVGDLSTPEPKPAPPPAPESREPAEQTPDPAASEPRPPGRP